MLIATWKVKFLNCTLQGTVFALFLKWPEGLTLPRTHYYTISDLSIMTQKPLVHCHGPLLVFHLKYQFSNIFSESALICFSLNFKALAGQEVAAECQYAVFALALVLVLVIALALALTFAQSTINWCQKRQIQLSHHHHLTPCDRIQQWSNPCNINRDHPIHCHHWIFLILTKLKHGMVEMEEKSKSWMLFKGFYWEVSTWSNVEKKFVHMALG